MSLNPHRVRDNPIRVIKPNGQAVGLPALIPTKWLGGRVPAQVYPRQSNLPSAIVYSAAAARRGSTQFGRMKWQVYPFGMRSR